MRPFVQARRSAVRLSLAASPTVIAAMLALQPQAALAQAFQGTGTVVLGDVNRSSSGSMDFLVVNALQNTINWVPSDVAAGSAPINFLPAGATASFIGGSGTNGGNFTVLNRIIAADPSRAIQFAGTVTSGAAGRIWFYAPGGLLLTGTSRFNVGSLLLTANDPVGAAAGLPYLDDTGSFRLQAAAGSTAAINVQAGAQINAVNSGSYVIAVAPRFDMAGAININGSAALAAVGDASFTLNGGLFDITANLGSGAGGTSSVTGSITGPAGASGQGVHHRIYLMAVPRNDAMTLLITGGAEIGFAVAAAADVDGNAIVLSGGYDIRGTAAGSGLGQFGDAPAASSAGTATIRATAAVFSSNVTVRSKNVAEVMAQAGAVTAARDLEIFADTAASAGAANGNTLLVNRSLTVDASNYLIGSAGGARTAGNALVSVQGASAVQAGTETTVRAVGTGDSASGAGQAGGNGAGGTAQVDVSGGSIMNSPFLSVDASGTGGDALAGRGGSGAGGNALMRVDAAGQVVTVNLRITAFGFGSLGESGQMSGNAQGGTASLTLDGGTVGFPQALINVEANASYKSREGAAHLGGGQATGGIVSVNVQNRSALTAEFLNVNAEARSAFGGGNNGYFGGAASLIVNDVDGSTSVAAQSIRIRASATASDGEFGGNISGGAATGGFARLLTTGNPVISGSELLVAANATGGNGAGGIGGQALGGRAHLDMQDGGSLLASTNVSISGSALGGAGTVGGKAAGYGLDSEQEPAIFVRLGPGSVQGDLGIQTGILFADASATGGDGSVGAGGTASGGVAFVRLQSGDTGTGTFSLLSNGQGGSGFIGAGAGTGGNIRIDVEGGAKLTSALQVLSANGFGGMAAGTGTGGVGTGGTANLTVIDGTLASGQVTLDASGVGGTAQAGTGGSGIGGTALMQLGATSTVSVQDIGLFALGTGTVGNSDQLSGDARGGTARLNLNGTALALTGSISVLADALYGDQGPTAHLGGGQVIGGTANLNVGNGTVLNADRLQISADASGFNASGNNVFRGGTAELSVTDAGGATRITLQTGISISALAHASDGAFGGNTAGGAAFGGFARLLTTGNPFLSVTNGSVDITAAARAGHGAGSAGPLRAPGSGRSSSAAGGEALGGRAHLDMQNGGTLLVAGSLTLGASADAGDGTTGGNAAALDNGDGGQPAVLVRLGAGSGCGDKGITVGGDLIFAGRAVGGNSTAGIGGTARGGLLSLVIDSGGLSARSLLMDAAATGGAGTIGGDARSGRIFQRISDGNVTVQGNAQFELDATGGSAGFGTGGRGGDAVVGQSIFTLSSLEGGLGASFTAANLLIVARAAAGAGGSGEIGGGAGGDALGSDPNLADASLQIGIQPARSVFTVGELVIINSVQGGGGGEGLAGSNGGAGGTAARGFTNIGVISGPVTPVSNRSTANFGNVTIFARSTGGNGGSASLDGLGGRGGEAAGGMAAVVTRGGIVTANNISIDLAGEGGSAGFAAAADLGAGNGTGGNGGLLVTPHFTAALPGQMAIAGAVTINANGVGGNAISGGGVGNGGTARIELKRHEAAGAAAAAVSGNLTIAGNVQLDSSARGGSGLDTGNGGNGFGGLSLLFTQAGTSQLGGFTDLVSIGTGGGQGQKGVLTGNGNGGEAQIALDGGLMTIGGNLSADTRGQFGKASGGGVRLTTTAAGGSLLLDGGTVTLNANAISGDGFEFGPAQDAFGGGIVITVGAGSLMRVRQPKADGALTMSADAEVRNINQFSASDSYGGGIIITADGRLEMYGGSGDLALSATSRAGAGGALLAGGEAFGGGIRITANAAGSILFDSEGQLLRVAANSYGGDSDVLSGNGGGSGISIDANGGTITVAGATSMQADGFAGNGAPGGKGSGGGVRLKFDAGGTLAFGGPLSIVARGSGVQSEGGLVEIFSVGGGTMNVAGNLNADIEAFYTASANNIDLKGGFLHIETAEASVFDVSGTINLSAGASTQGFGANARLLGGGLRWNHRGTATIAGGISAAAGAAFGDGTVGTGTGGQVNITAFSGVLTTGGLQFLAAANAGFADNGVPSAATGGQLEIGTVAGAEFRINSSVFFDASAVGSIANGGVGGEGRGGSIRIANAGIMRIDTGEGDVVLRVGGVGGNSFGRQGGVGRGGIIQITNEAGGSFRLNTGMAMIANASGLGGDGLDGGRGGGAAGGSITVSNAGNFDIPVDLDLTANARSGDGLGAGDAFGGAVSLAQSDGSFGVRGDLRLDAQGDGGSNRNAGNGTGGTLDVSVTGGTLNVALGGLQMLAGSTGFNAAGGTIRILSGGVLNAANGIDLQVDSRGGFSHPEALMLGGNIAIDVIAGGRLEAGGRLDANLSTETDQALAGQARAGNFALNSAGTVIFGGNIAIDADVRHDGIAPLGLDGFGGNIGMTLTAGSMTANSVGLSATGAGGASSGEGASGDGAGGSIVVAVSGGAQLTVADSLGLFAGGFAGTANGSGAGGVGTAGTARVTVNGAGTQLVAGSGLFFVDANGGDASGGGQGGSGVGGTAELLIGNGGSAEFTNRFGMDGLSFGGNNAGSGIGGGGSATSGTLRALVDGASGGTMTLAPGAMGFARFNSDSFGGNVQDMGGSGGAASGGSIQIGSTGNGGTVNIGKLQVSSFARGGIGGSGAAPGNGGAAQGSSVSIGMGRDASSAAPGSFTAETVNAFTSGEGGSAGNVDARNGSAAGGFIRLIVNGASGRVIGGVQLTTGASTRGPGRPGGAAGGRIELGVADAANGLAAGTLTIGGATDLSNRTTNPVGPLTHGVLRVFAAGTGSRLALQDVFTASDTVTGAAVPGLAERSGIVAGVGARIDFTGNVQFASRGDIGFNDGGTITATGEMLISSGGRVVSAFGTPTLGATGVVAAPRLEISATGDLDLATNTTGSGDVVLTSSGRLRVADIDANRDVTLRGTGGVSFASLRADRTLGVFSDVAINGGSASAGGRLTLQSDGSIAVGALDAGTIDPAAGETANVYVRALGPVTTGSVASAGDIGLLAQGALASGNLQSGRDVVLLSGGTINTGSIAAPAAGRVRMSDFAQRSLIVFSGGVPNYTALFAAAPAAVSGNITVGGNVTAGLFEARTAGVLQINGAINSALGTRLNAGSLRLGGITSQGFLDLVSIASVVLGDLAAPGAMSITSNGSITTGNIAAGQSLVLSATQPGTSLTTGNVRAAAEIRLSSATTITTGALSAGNRVFLTAGGAVVTGAIDAGTVNPPRGAAGVLFATSNGTIRTGAINVSGSATLSGVLGVNTGNIAAPAGIVLLDTGGVTTGSLLTSGTGFVYIAAHDLLPQITFDEGDNPVFAALLARTPVRLIGDIAIGGAATTGRFLAAATGSFAAQAITAPTGVLVDVGGAATLAGSIASAVIAITSRDIAIAGGTVIGGDGAQTIQLNTDAAATAAVIGGDGTQAAGTYSLSNAEFGTLRASSITVRSGAAPMTVQQLALPAIAPGSAASPGVTLQTSGVLRVTGAVTMAQAGSGNQLSLIAGTRIEVVQGSGSVRLGGVDAPAGTLSLRALRVWAASDSLLGQLAGGQLAGAARDTALNAAGSPAVAGGSIGAGTILVSVGNEFLVQNSGTDQLKAGFTAGSGGIRISRLGDATTPIDVVINGRIQRADSSFAANRDTLALVRFEPGATILTANSAVNGCLVTAGCIIVVPDPEPEPELGLISQQVLTIVNNIDALTPEEEARREAARASSEKLPIVVMQRLIDLSPLFTDPDATDPVTSGGNPALWLDPLPSGVRAPGGLK